MPPPSKLLNDDGARDHEDRAQTFTIDSFLANVAGEFGPYQVKHYAIVGSAWISVAVATLSMVLTGQAPRWRSERDGYNATHTEAPACDNVNFQESLEPFDFVRPWESTTAEWALVCDRANFAALLGTLVFIGFGIGAFGLGSAADRIGRLPTCKLAACIAAVGALASAAAQTAQIYALCRLVAGVGAGGLSTSAYVLATELVGPSWQGVCGVGLSGIFSFGGLLLAPCSLLFPSWRGLTLCTAVFRDTELAALREPLPIGVLAELDPCPCPCPCPELELSRVLAVADVSILWGIFIITGEHTAPNCCSDICPSPLLPWSSLEWSRSAILYMLSSLITSDRAAAESELSTPKLVWRSSLAHKPSKATLKSRKQRWPFESLSRRSKRARTRRSAFACSNWLLLWLTRTLFALSDASFSASSFNFRNRASRFYIQ